MPTTRSPSTDCIACVTRPAGLVKLMTHASGASACDPLGDVQRGRHRAQPVADPARTRRLLAEQPEAESEPLVDGATLETADADRREDEVGTGQRLVEVGRDASPSARPRARSRPPRAPAP